MVVADTDQRRNLTGVITTGSISSTVELDFDRGTAHKTYKPPLWVRLLYWIVFQAPFPYVANHAALEAARYRRQIVGFLTKFWYGEDFVAPVLTFTMRATVVMALSPNSYVARRSKTRNTLASS